MTLGHLRKTDPQLLLEQIGNLFFWNDPMSYGGTLSYYLELSTAKSKFYQFCNIYFWPLFSVQWKQSRNTDNHNIIWNQFGNERDMVWK